MKYVIHWVVFCFIRYSTTEFIAINRKPANIHCEGAEKNAIIERFFNVIFAEFHYTPPVCVCVQMCVGQSTYCYPNACLKRDDLRRVDAPEVPGVKSGRKQFMFVIDAKPELAQDYFDHPLDNAKVATTTVRPLLPYDPEFFKDNNFKKYRKHLPQVELRYNLREQVKNLKVENADLSKTRWPMNKHNVLSGQRLRSNVEKVPPVVGKSKFFMSMLTENNVADYPPKYYKRDVKKFSDDYETNVKDVFIYNTADNATDMTSFSLETLIDNLIKISYESNFKENINRSEVKTNDERKLSKFSDLTVVPLNLSKTTNTSINFNQDTDNNRNPDEKESTNKISGMIVNLEKRIEKQNNTSMEMAKRIITDIDFELTTEEVAKEYHVNDKNVELNNADEFNNKTDNIRSVSTKINDNKTILRQDYEIGTTTVTDAVETVVTKKVKRRLPRKLSNKNMN